MRRAAACLALLGFSHLGWGQTSDRSPAVERSRYVMGTTATVRIEGFGSSPAHLAGANGDAPAAAAEAALDRIDEVDRAASLYKPESDIVRINETAYPRAAKAGPVMMALLEEALRLARVTGGAFDPTIKPLMDELGFYREIGARQGPDGIEGALDRVGWRRVDLDAARGTIRFERPGMALDLGGIGKGYALDRGMAELRARGVVSAQLALSRQYAFLGRDPATATGNFRLAVSVPDKDGGETVRCVIDAPEGSVSTSSALSQTRSHAGKPAGHIVDPRRGLLVTNVRAVAVWAPEGASADALSTALVVSGPRALRCLRRKLRFEALIIVEAGSVKGAVPLAPGLEAVATPGMVWSPIPLL